MPKWLEDLLPLALLGVLGYMLYTKLFPGVTEGQEYANMGALVGTPGTISGGGGGGGGNLPTFTAIPSAARAAITTPGTFIVPEVQGPTQGSGIGGLFVVAGPSTPSNFFPLGNVITSDRPLDQAEQIKVLQNLANSGIKNAWWSPQTLTPLSSGAAGINSGGSPQSNIPVGVRHCRGPGPGAPSTDTWHICAPGET